MKTETLKADNTRGYSFGDVEVRAEGENSYVYGIALRYETLSRPMANFSDGTVLYERISRGALDGCDLTDVVCLRDHKPELLLGRTQSGTLSLTVTSEGLEYRCLLPKLGAGAETRELLERNDISGSSFSWPYSAWEYNYETLDNGDIVRNITKLSKLIDVSPVAFPAYPQTMSALSKRSFLEENGLLVDEKPEVKDEQPKTDGNYSKYLQRNKLHRLMNTSF